MRWLFSNSRNRLLFAARNPIYAFRSLFREITFADERFLSNITGVPTQQIRSYLDEPISTAPFVACLQEAESIMRNVKLQSADLYAKKVLIQYIAVRAFQPEIIVETGVANGVSSAYLLLALQKNAGGRLFSIDLGDPSYLPQGKPPGWIVPDWLKERWVLLIGDSRQLLPNLLPELGTIDIFIHDSLHTYDQMLWEYRTAFPFIRPGGLLFSDDAAWNPAFQQFSEEVKAPQSAVLRGVGFLKKGLNMSLPALLLL